MKHINLILLCLLFCASSASGKIPTPQEVGVPERFITTVAGSIVLKTGGTTSLTISKEVSYELGTKKNFRGEVIRVDNADWMIFAPAQVINQGTDSATIKATAPGNGYIQAHRYLDYRDENGDIIRGLLIKIWILVVNETGRIESEDKTPSGITSGPGIKPDISRASLSGRAVMRGTDEGVANAMVQLIGQKSGINRDITTTDSGGNFDAVIKDLLSGDRYEVFVRKGSANVSRADSFQEDLWPIHKYYVSITHENCENVNVGRIEMTSVNDLWGNDKAKERKEVDIKIATPPSTPGSKTSSSSGQQPGMTGSLPWKEIESGAIRIFISKSENEGTEIDITDEAGRTARSMQIDYKGYAEVDFHLKASMSLNLDGNSVEGELYAPAIHGQNVRLPGARVKLQGELNGGWEDGGSIAGECSGHILWPGGQPEERAGSFEIKKVGNEIHFRSTKFYYNRYIFAAKGIKYAPSSGATTSGSFANSIIILIDASGSMSGAKMNNAKSTAKRRIAELGPNTELAVIAFSGNSLKFPFAMMDDAGRASAQAAVDNINAGGGTPLAAAIREAGVYMRKNAGGKRLTLLVLSDGVETAGGNPPEEVQRLNDMKVNW